MQIARRGRARDDGGRRVAAALVAGALVLAGCGANASSGSSGAGAGPASNGESPSGAKGTIGVILPETATSARWEAFDKPFLVEALEGKGFAAHVENAQGDVQKFASLADGMIASGVKALIIASPNAQVGTTCSRRPRRRASRRSTTTG